jgi:hypothetical protein
VVKVTGTTSKGRATLETKEEMVVVADAVVGVANSEARRISLAGMVKVRGTSRSRVSLTAIRNQEIQMSRKPVLKKLIMKIGTTRVTMTVARVILSRRCKSGTVL